jgi:BTB/POZ domain
MYPQHQLLSRFKTQLVALNGLNEELRGSEIKVAVSSSGTALFEFSSLLTTSETVNFGTKSSSRATVLGTLAPSGSLVFDVIVTLKLLKEQTTQNIEHNPIQMNKEVAMNNIEMLKNPKFSDFKFIVKGKEFKVHRAVLANASPVFDKLFTADMKESRSNQCIVKDIEPEIFQHLLQFVYGGKLPEDIAAVALKLFEAAHYYDIGGLKEICKQKLMEKLTTENAMEIYKWAWIYEGEILNTEAWKIIKR